MAYPGEPIRAGARGPVVTAIQERLKAHGIVPIDVDGIFGGQTDAAVRLFQVRFPDATGQPLRVDGVVGEMTWARLFGEDIAKKSVASSTLSAAALSVAIGEIGAMEVPPGSNRGPKVEAYLGSVGLGGGYPWCASFVHWCFETAATQLGVANPCPRTGGVHEMWRRSIEAGRRHYVAAQLRDHPGLLAPGQVFFLDEGHQTGHVGLIESVSGVVLTTIEGNTNDGGSREGVGVFRRTTRRISDSVFMGVADMTLPPG